MARTYNQDYFKVDGSRIEDRDEARLSRLARNAIEAKEHGRLEKKKKPRKTAVKKAEERKAGKRPALAGAAATKPRAGGTHSGDPVTRAAIAKAPAPKPAPRPAALKPAPKPGAVKPALKPAAQKPAAQKPAAQKPAAQKARAPKAPPRIKLAPKREEVAAEKFPDAMPRVRFTGIARHLIAAPFTVARLLRNLRHK